MDFFGPPPLGEKRPYDFTTVSMSVCQFVSMSVGKRVFSKTAHRVFLKLPKKLGCLKGKNNGARNLGKNLILGINTKAQKYPKNRVFWILQKKKNSPLMCKFVWFK